MVHFVLTDNANSGYSGISTYNSLTKTTCDSLCKYKKTLCKDQIYITKKRMAMVKNESDIQ